MIERWAQIEGRQVQVVVELDERLPVVMTEPFYGIGFVPSALSLSDLRIEKIEGFGVGDTVVLHQQEINEDPFINRFFTWSPDQPKPVLERLNKEGEIVNTNTSE